MNVKDVISNIEELNKKISQYNEAGKEVRWKREELYKNIITSIQEYNSQYGTNLSIETPNSIIEEANKVLQTKLKTYHTLNKALELAENKDFAKVEQLLGVKVDKGAEIVITADLVNVDDLDSNINATLENFKYAEEQEELEIKQVPQVEQPIQQQAKQQVQQAVQQQPELDIVIENPAPQVEQPQSKPIEDLDPKTDTQDYIKALLGDDPVQPADEGISLEVGTQNPEPTTKEAISNVIDNGLALDSDDFTSDSSAEDLLSGIGNTSISLDQLSI